MKLKILFYLSILLFAISCDNAILRSHYLGEVFECGVVFHLYKDEDDADHGLIVAFNDQSSSAVFSNVTGSLAGAISTWDGKGNSEAIVSQSGHTESAAKLCADLNVCGKSGWYLP